MIVCATIYKLQMVTLVLVLRVDDFSQVGSVFKLVVKYILLMRIDVSSLCENQLPQELSNVSYLGSNSDMRGD
jgi:hypothetical protein